MNDEARERTISPKLLATLVVVCAVGAFVLPIDGSFIYDDRTLIASNRFVHGFSHWQHWFSSGLWETNVDQGANKLNLSFWRPAVLATFAFDWWLGKGNPFLFHATNLLAHAVTSALAFVTLRRWSRSAPGAFVGALLFALHPSKVECVSWIAGRTDVLCTLGIFIALQGVARRLRGDRSGIALEVAGTLLAYLSKEQAVVMPAFVAVEAWAIERSVDRKNLVRGAGPHVAIALAYLVSRHFFLPIGHSHSAIAFGTHVAYALESVGRYVVLFAWPSDLSLGRAQRVFVHGVATPVWPFVVAGVASIVAVAACIWICRRRAPAISAGLLLAAVALAPVCNIVWIGYFVLVSPRFLYLPVFGMAFVAAEIVAAFDSQRRVVLLRAAFGVIIAALGVRAIARSADFESEDAFWAYEIAQNPTYSPALMYEIGQALDKGRPHAALREAIDAHAKLDHIPEHRSAITLLVIRATLQLVPDLARDALVAIRTFISDVRSARDAHLSLAPLGLELSLRGMEAESQAMRLHSDMALESLDGEIASRLGDDAAALATAMHIAAVCADCSNLLFPMSRVAARAGDLDLAQTLLDDLRAVGWTPDANRFSHDLDRGRQLAQARQSAQGVYRTIIDTQYYALFGAWGRAYEAAKPAIDAGDTLDPETARSLGDLCFRAGDTPAATKLLSRTMTKADVARHTDALALEMQWVDAP
jgi:hypothetical protein